MGTKVFLVILFAFGNASILKIDEDFKYQRISVEVSDKVPRHLCQNTLDRLEELLSATSSQLYLSTRGKAAFDSISILLPSSWSGTDCLNGRPINDKISLDPRQTDFLVTNGHPIFGDQKPITLQYGQCGQTGLGIRIPHQLLSQSQNLTQKTKLETFAEWVHYRYGTFAEVGSDLDPRYPAYHSNGLLEEPTISHGCNLTLDDEQMVDASILRNKAICDSTNDFYDRNAPTKQNLLCNRQAAQEVMLNHPDLQDINLQKKIRHVESFQIELVTQEDSEAQESSSLNQLEGPSFSYVLPSQKRHILVLDVSQNMNVDRQWEMARNALFRYVNHVPTGDQIGIVTFGANARVNIEPTIVTESNREGLYGRIPFRLLNGQQGCLECGLRMAMQMVNYNYKTDILVLTATAGHGSQGLQEIQDMVEELALPVNLVSFEPQLNSEVVKLTKYGGIFGLQSQFVQQNLADSFLEILNGNAPLRSKVQKSYHRTFSLDHQRHETTTSGGKRGIAISGNFIVEENLRNNLWVVLTSPYKEDVELFEVTSPSGVPKVFPKFENGIVYFYLEGLSEPGIWSYKASLYPVSIARNEVTIEVFAQPTDTQNDQDTFKVQAWTNVDHNGVKASQKPVIIYAQVTQGPDLPVMNAQVTAYITKPDSSVPYELVLNDRGTGYPDITSGDGIYSGYFTGFSTQEGLYSVDIKVTHNGGEASVPNLLNTQDLTSPSGTSVYIPTELMYTTPTAQFTRYVKAVSFYVSQGVQYFVDNGQPSMEDIFPPSRVTDLKVQSMVNNTLYATLQWSAPGGDFDQGAAHHYDIRCYTNAEALSDTNFAEMGIPVHESLLPTPGILDDTQTATVGLPWSNEVFYYGLVSVDESGNRSPVSNLVPVYASEVITNTDNEVYVEESHGKALSSVFNEMVQGDNLYIIVGVIAGMVVVIAFLVITLWVRAKQQRASEKRKQNARTQIFVNDLEANNAGLPDLAPEKVGQNYSEVWATHNSGLPTNASPTNSSLEEYANMYINTSHHRNYPLTTVPVHEYRSTYPTESTTVETPTYQNWNHKPPSDNGTATTSSTECYDDHNSDHSKGIRVAPLRRYSVDDYLVPPGHHTNRSMGDPSALSLSPSFCSASEKRRRQESLV